MTKNYLTLAETLGNNLKARQLMIVTAESCTGGLLAEIITSIAGSSTWFERGFVTYSNLAKQEMLGVQETTLNQHGAVSEQTAIEMALGALKNSHGHISIAITGIAGPEGGSSEKPVGTVWFAWAKRNGDCHAQMRQFTGDRTAIRQQAAEFALMELIALIQ